MSNCLTTKPVLSPLVPWPHLQNCVLNKHDLECIYSTAFCYFDIVHYVDSNLTARRFWVCVVFVLFACSLLEVHVFIMLNAFIND